MQRRRQAPVAAPAQLPLKLADAGMLNAASWTLLDDRQLQGRPEGQCMHAPTAQLSDANGAHATGWVPLSAAGSGGGL